jgi:hypothetical protein
VSGHDKEAALGGLVVLRKSQQTPISQNTACLELWYSDAVDQGTAQAPVLPHLSLDLLRHEVQPRMNLQRQTLKAGP